MKRLSYVHFAWKFKILKIEAGAGPKWRLRFQLPNTPAPCGNGSETLQKRPETDNKKYISRNLVAELSPSWKGPKMKGRKLHLFLPISFINHPILSPGTTAAFSQAFLPNFCQSFFLFWDQKSEMKTLLFHYALLQYKGTASREKCVKPIWQMPYRANQRTTNRGNIILLMIRGVFAVMYAAKWLMRSASDCTQNLDIANDRTLNLEATSLWPHTQNFGCYQNSEGQSNNEK